MRKPQSSRILLARKAGAPARVRRSAEQPNAHKKTLPRKQQAAYKVELSAQRNNKQGPRTMALSCLSSDGAVTKQAVKKIAEFACTWSPQVSFYTSGHRAASIPTGTDFWLFHRTSTPMFNTTSGLFSWAGPSPPQSFESVNVNLNKLEGSAAYTLNNGLVFSPSRFPSNQGMFSLFPLENICPYPCITLPMAQCWGGGVAGYLDVSFTVAVPPTRSTRISLGMFYGFPGHVQPDRNSPVTTGYQGSSAFESSGGLVGVTVEVTGPSNTPVQSSSPYKRLVMPIKYSRNAPYSPKAIDNQYVVVLWAEFHDPQIVLTDFRVKFVASAATDTITTGWSGNSVPESLNTPLPWGVQ